MNLSGTATRSVSFSFSSSVPGFRGDMVIRGAKSEIQECQTRGWCEKHHNVECKILKVVRGIQVRDGDLIS